MINVELTISLVLYKACAKEVSATLNALISSVSCANIGYHLIVIDNTPSDIELEIDLSDIQKIVPDCNVTYIRTGVNEGFGLAHNLALKVSSIYHLILNPDVEMNHDAISNAISFMEKHADCGMLSPYATWGDGMKQPLCKRYPSVTIFLLRAFAPDIVKRLFVKKLSAYEMRDVIGTNEVYWDPLLVSGCFMFLRTDIWKRSGGFSPRYFLYFEDFDLSLRIKKLCRIAYVPDVRIIHHGGNSSKKGGRHIRLFGRSMVTFFNIHGWKFW